MAWHNLECNDGFGGENIGIAEDIEEKFDDDDDDASTPWLKRNMDDDNIDNINGNTVLVPPEYDDDDDVKVVDCEKTSNFFLFILLY